MPHIQILGGGREVGKSCIRLDINQHRFLVDCGVDPAVEGRAALPDLSGTRIDQLNAVFVSHAHLDHTGGIPDLVRRGFHGKVFMTLPTLALLNLLWQDELSIMEREWPKEERLWSSKEMHQVLMKMAVPTTYHEVFKLNSIQVNFHNAGHILGSTMTEFSYNGFRIVFSGDLGTSSNHLRYWRTEDLANPDVLVCEGTYGGKNRKGRSEVEKELLESIRITLEEGEKVLIPMFAVGKTQEILKILNDSRNKLPNVDVYLEGMSIDTLRVY
jgi:Cft2 family RNA processing exonuclease